MQIYIAAAVTVLLIITGINLAVTIAANCGRVKRAWSERYDSEVGVAEKGPTPSDLMDEGFDNIMRFEVNGKTGFERE